MTITYDSLNYMSVRERTHILNFCHINDKLCSMLQQTHSIIVIDTNQKLLQHNSQQIVSNIRAIKISFNSNS